MILVFCIADTKDFVDDKIGRASSASLVKYKHGDGL